MSAAPVPQPTQVTSSGLNASARTRLRAWCLANGFDPSTAAEPYALNHQAGVITVNGYVPDPAQGAADFPEFLTDDRGRYLTDIKVVPLKVDLPHDLAAYMAIHAG